MMLPSERNEARRLHVLVSFAYWHDARALEKIKGMPREWNVMLDSGAFTNFTTGKEATKLEDYADFCEENKSLFWKIINLDKIGDPIQSDKNFQYLRKRDLPIVPVFQRGDTVDELYRMANESYVVCIGGISQNLGMKEEQEYIKSVVRAAKARDVRIHLLGGGRRELLRYPVWSADSSTWKNPIRFGQMMLWYRGNTYRFHKNQCNRLGKGYIKPTLDRTQALAAYDLTWSDLIKKENWDPDGIIPIANARAWIRFALHLAAADRRSVFAMIPGSLDIMRPAWELEKNSWPKD